MRAFVLVGVVLFSAITASSQGDDRVATISVLINRGIEENENQIRDQAKGLSDAQRLYLYDQNETGAGLPFVLNLFLGFGIGSWVQGHTAGGLIGSIGNLAGIGMMAAGSESQTVGTIGAVVFVGTYITDLILPWTYASGQNAALRRALLLNGSASLNVVPGIRSYAVGPTVPSMTVQLTF